MTGIDPVVDSRIPRREFVYRKLPLLLWALFILIVSSIPGDQMPELSTFWEWDKVAHAGVYFIFGLLLVRWTGAVTLSCLPRLLLITFLFASFDELHQLIIPNRECSVWDLLADMLGAAAGIGAGVFLARRKSRKSLSGKT